MAKRDTPDSEAIPDLREAEQEALHRVELGVEWLHRAHGNLVEFHHKTGHAMDHLAEAEELLRECGHGGLADALRDEYLPRGVIDEDRWSYDVLESYQEGFLSDLTAFETLARDEVADGHRHVNEREMEREWKERASEGAERPRSAEKSNGDQREP